MAQTTGNHAHNGEVSPSTSELAEGQHAAESSDSAIVSLEGIQYPRTPYAEFVIPPAMANAVADQPSNRDELRFAKRDVVTPHQTPVYSSPPPSGHARFDGDIITRPQ
jgi:hypothetical protein